jgi:cysteine desulfurase/selenocysteine lyase
MSTNTTSTSDRSALDSMTSSPEQEEGRQKFEGVPSLMTALPDPAVIARLANEFFAALPASPVPPDAAVPPVSPNEVDLPAVSSLAPPIAVPDYPREVISTPAAPNLHSVPRPPQQPVSPPFGDLNEADFRAIAATLGGVTALAPQFPTAAPPSAMAGASSPGVEGSGPLSAVPQFVSPDRMFSFPGVPAIPSSPPTAPPGGSDLAAVPTSPASAGSFAPPAPVQAGTYQALSDSEQGRRTDPWAVAPNFLELSETFSFPRVPGMSVPGIPESAPSQPNVPPDQPIHGAMPFAPVTDTPKSTPGLSEFTLAPAIPEAATDKADVDNSVPGNSLPKFPSLSEMFSLPGVPGMQSPPGVPVLPSSVPAKFPSVEDLRSPSGALTGGPASASQVAAVTQSPVYVPSGNILEKERAEPRAAALPRGVESVELRPNVIPPAELSKRPLDPRLIRQDFPILQERVNGRPLIWLDNAATTQKPNAVIDRLSAFYRHENSNIHRAAHTLAARATDAYESAREKVRRFLNASSTREIIFVRGTTEGINLVAQAWGRRYVQQGDEVVITWLEHHANIVPWQQLCSEKGAHLRVAPVNDRGEVILEEYERLLNPRTRIVSFSQVSNALGTITPAREMVEMAHRHGARVLVDGAQAVSHMSVDVQALDCDFYVFSGHKIFGPTGIGAVYGKLDVLDTTPPWHGGGNMIVDVTFEKTTYQTPPGRFEAGTGNIADAVGLGAALDYVEQVGMESISTYEHELLNYATAGLLTVPGLRLIGTAREKAGVLSFVLDDYRTEDVGVALNFDGIAVRSGHHCAQPILRRMGVEATVRPSLAFYNTSEEIDALVAALLRLQASRPHRKL